MSIKNNCKYIVYLILFLPTMIHANGDPVAHYSAITRSCNPMPMKIKDIQLVSERLYIVPEDMYTKVTVKYILRNTSDKDYDHIDYGFPIDYSGQGHFHFVNDYWSETIYANGWNDSYIKNIAFFSNGKSLLWTHSKDTIIEKGKKILAAGYDLYDSIPESELYKQYGEEIYDTVYDISRRWYYTQFSIQKNAFVELEVTYKLLTNYGTPLYEVFSLSNRYKSSGCHFRYDFSPSSNWGDGTAHDLYVEIDTSRIILYKWGHDEWEILPFKGLSLKNKNGKLIYHTHNFDLTNAQPLELNFHTKGQLPINELLNKRINNNLYTVTVSGETKKYPVSYLSDMRLETAWVSEKSDLSDTITVTIQFKKPTNVSDILFFNGYTKNATTFLENNRVKTMSIRVKRENIPSYEYISNYGTTHDGNIPKWVCCEKIPELFTLEDVFSVAEVINISPSFYGGYDFIQDYDKYKLQKVVELKFQILDVFSGSKYKDLCISEIMLFSE